MTDTRMGVNVRMLLFVAVFAVQMVVLPVRQVEAAIPALVAGAGVFFKTPMGKALVTSLLLHAGVLSLELHDQASATTPPADDTNKRLEIKINPKDPMKTPAGWTAPTGGNVEPVAPATATSTGTLPNTTGLCFQGNGNFCLSTYGTIAEASRQACISGNGTRSGVTQQSSPYNYWACAFANGTLTGNLVSANCNGGATTNVGGQPSCGAGTVQCPTGYTNVSGTCTKSDESVIVKPSDNMMEIKRVSNVLYVDARDSLDGLPPNTTITPSDATFTDSYGNQWNYHINSDGTSVSTETKPRTDGSGKTDEIVSAFSAPDATTGEVKLEGVSTKVYTGTGTQKSATADGAPSGGDAKDSTLQAIKASIDAGNDEMKGTGVSAMPDQKALIDAQKASGEADLLSAHNAAKSGFSTDLSMWSAWAWTPSAAACVDPTTTIHGEELTYPICDKLWLIRDALGFLFAMFAAWDIYNSLFRRRALL